MEVFWSYFCLPISVTFLDSICTDKVSVPDSMLRLTDIFFANRFLKGSWVFEKITLVGLALESIDLLQKLVWQRVHILLRCEIMGKCSENYRNILLYVITERLRGTRGVQLGNNQVPLRYKEFKLTVGYTGIVQPKKNRKSANHMRIKSDKVWANK